MNGIVGLLIVLVIVNIGGFLRLHVIDSFSCWETVKSLVILNIIVMFLFIGDYLSDK